MNLAIGIHVWRSAGAVTAMRTGQIDAMANLDPVIGTLLKENEVRVIADTRTVADTKTIFGGNMPSACLYASEEFITKNPNTAQALANAIVRADKWIQANDAETIAKTVPATYLLGDSVTQFSTVIGTYLFAMGIGSWLSRYVTRGVVSRFVAVELLVGLIGGLSSTVLYFTFAYTDAFQLVLYGLVLLIGILAEALGEVAFSLANNHLMELLLTLDALNPERFEPIDLSALQAFASLAAATVSAIAAMKSSKLTVRSLQEYHAAPASQR